MQWKQEMSTKVFVDRPGKGWRSVDECYWTSDEIPAMDWWEAKSFLRLLHRRRYKPRSWANVYRNFWFVKRLGNRDSAQSLMWLERLQQVVISSSSSSFKCALQNSWYFLLHLFLRNNIEVSKWEAYCCFAWRNLFSQAAHNGNSHSVRNNGPGLDFHRVLTTLCR